MAKMRDLHAPPAIAYVSLFLLGLLVAAAAHSVSDSAIEVNHRELLRVSSPDGRIDAVLVEPIIKYFGKTLSVYLVPKGEAPPAWGPVMGISGVDRMPTLLWREPQLLEIGFERGCVERFSNLWHSNDIERGDYYVEIGLAPVGAFACLKEPPAKAQRVITPAGAP
ncbi:MAG: hypothetical protein ACYDC3_04895 [Candidatus Binataceae bacterium]